MSNSAKESYFKAIEYSDLYDQLKTYIKCKNYSAVTEFLKKHNSQEFQEYIIDLVAGNDLELFGNSRPSEATIMVNKIVSAFSSQHQLKFVAKLKPDYFNYITLQLIKDKENLLDSAVLQKYISHRMHHGKFEDIIKANEVLNTNVLVHDSQYISYYKNVITLPILNNMRIDDKKYQGLYDIIYAYTPEKEQFLISQNITLPSIELAQNITAYIVEQIQKKKITVHPEYFYEGLQKYSSIMMYAELQESLPNNNKPKSYKKI